ncbi:MAG: zinc-dependent metalloprotease [Ferruginibacter sp.]
MRKILLLTVSAWLTILSSQAQQTDVVLVSKLPPKTAADTAKTKKSTVAEKIKSSIKNEGLFTVYQDTATGTVQLYIKKDQLKKEFIYQSFSINGPTSLFLNQGMHRRTDILKIQKVFDKLEFAEVNTSFYYDKSNAISKTQGVDVPEAILFSEKVVAEDPNGYLISADGLFISEKMDPVKPVQPPGPLTGLFFNLGSLNTAKSKVRNIRSFPKNTDLQVDLAYDNPSPSNRGGKDITDARYITVCMQHTFIEMPQNDFRPRRDDPRIGFFTREVNDQTSIESVPFRDIINRWNLVKEDSTQAISEPVEPIVWWIENTTPVEYRQTIKEAGEKWNEAFEKAGFKNAVVMKIMPDSTDWDPSDIRYNVIRWVSSALPEYGAIGPSFVNPRTGQILGSDITVEWFTGSAVPIYDELFSGPSAEQLQLANILPQQYCTAAAELKAQFTAGSTFLETSGAADNEIKEMHKQYLYYLVLHEMGHTLGLNHNMKSSQMLTPAELNDTTITHKKGLTGSVMDYPAINISPDKKKQGDYYTTRPGPYDLWAIEYGYTPVSGSKEEAFRKKVLSRSNEHDLAFGNDADDMRSPGKAIDPRVNISDMSSDAIGYAEDRFKLVNNIMPKLKEKYSKQDKGYADLRSRYFNLIAQRSGMISAVSRYVGGVYFDRSFVGQNSSEKPFTPVAVATQKRAIAILNKYVFAPNAFDADLSLIPYLQSQRRGFNFFSTTEDPKLSSTYAGLAAAALSHILHPITMQRITNSRLYGNTYSLVEVMSDLTKGIFDADAKGNVNVYRQYLQTAFVKNLLLMVEDRPNVDEMSKAAALYTSRNIKAKLLLPVASNEETKAHRANLVFLINNTLERK